MAQLRKPAECGRDEDGNPLFVYSYRVLYFVNGTDEEIEDEGEVGARNIYHANLQVRHKYDVGGNVLSYAELTDNAGTTSRRKYAGPFEIKRPDWTPVHGRLPADRPAAPPPEPAPTWALEDLEGMTEAPDFRNSVEPFDVVHTTH